MWRSICFIVMQLVNEFCGRCSQIPNFTQSMQFALISEISFCYFSTSFASLQEDLNKRHMWKNTWESQNFRFIVYIFNIWIIALNAELHLYSHIKYCGLLSSLSSVCGLPCQTCSYGPWTDIKVFNFIRIALDMNTRSMLKVSRVIQHCKCSELNCSGNQSYKSCTQNFELEVMGFVRVLN
jgi:hypothetical protein